MRKLNHQIIGNGHASLHPCKPCRPAAKRRNSFNAWWVPDADVYVTDGGLVILMELAGLGCQNLKLTTEGNRLTISGYRPDQRPTDKCSFQAMELKYGPFERVVDLPDGYDLALGQATYKNGFLRLNVPAMDRPYGTNAAR